MIFQNLTEEDGWVTVEYAATWGYGYDFMLDAAQIIINTDLRTNLQQVAVSAAPGMEYKNYLNEVVDSNFDLRSCPMTKMENGSIIIAGDSSIMSCPMQIMFFNQTNVVRLCSPEPDYFKQNGEHVFDNYLNSVEIKAHCMNTEREIKAKYENK